MHAPAQNHAGLAGLPAGRGLGLGPAGPRRAANSRRRRFLGNSPEFLSQFRGHPAFLREHESFVPEAKRFVPEAKWFGLEAISFGRGAKSFMPEAKSLVLGAKRFMPEHASFVLEAKPLVPEHASFVPEAKSFVPMPLRPKPALYPATPQPFYAHCLLGFRRPGNVFRQSESKVGLAQLSLGGWRSGVCPADPAR